MGYSSRKEHTLVGMRLYLPKDWAKDKARRKKCGVPKQIRYQTRHELALDMLKNNGKYLSHAWIAGDDEMGRSSRFRRDLRALDEQYLLAVPSNTNIRDMEVEPPAYGGHGQPPKQPFQRLDVWRDSLNKKDWTRIIEDSLKRAKSEAGLSDYEVRTWAGWYHHQTLSLIATWFLICETRRGEKIYAGTDGSTGLHSAGYAVATRVRSQISRLADTLCEAKKQTPRVGSFSPL